MTYGDGPQIPLIDVTGETARYAGIILAVLSLLALIGPNGHYRNAVEEAIPLAQVTK
jgi:hypothetical protein